MSGRPNELTGIIGLKGTGKTPLVVGNAEYGIPSLAQIYITVKKMPVIVLDTIDHIAYRNLVTDLQPGCNFRKLKPAFYRIIGNKSDLQNVFRIFGQSKTNDLWNACVICEDIHKYVDEKTPPAVMDSVSDMKQKNNDMYYMGHAVDLVPRGIIMQTDNFEIFKQPDPTGRKKEMAACFDRYYAAWKRVMAHPSKFYHESISLHI